MALIHRYSEGNSFSLSFKQSLNLTDALLRACTRSLRPWNSPLCAGKPQTYSKGLDRQPFGIGVGCGTASLWREREKRVDAPFSEVPIIRSNGNHNNHKSVARKGSRQKQQWCYIGIGGKTPEKAVWRRTLASCTRRRLRRLRRRRIVWQEPVELWSEPLRHIACFNGKRLPFFC